MQYFETFVFLLAYATVAFIVVEGLYRCVRFLLFKQPRKPAPRKQAPPPRTRPIPPEPVAVEVPASTRTVKPAPIAIYKRRFRTRTGGR